MKKYIGTKIIHAERAINDKGDGYIVVYKDGYKSWSPKEAFEEAYVAVDSIPNKLTIGDILDTVASTDYVVLPDGRTTICQLTLRNGFTVRGESSCVDINNFDKEMGEKIACDNAIDKIWQLEGYLLAQRRFEAGVNQ